MLILEDNQARINYFTSACCDPVIVQTAHEAIDWLQKQEWDYVSLDHDLNGEIFVDSSRADCGMEVVRWMVQNKPKVSQRVIVHTANRRASEVMCNTLKEAGYWVIQAPFGGEFDPRG